MLLKRHLLICIMVFITISSGCGLDSQQSTAQTASEPAANAVLPVAQALSEAQTPSLTPQIMVPAVSPSPNIVLDNLDDLISAESLLAYVEDLTSIQPYSGWRNGGSRGEQEALDYIENTLNGFSTLMDNGLELERQSFSIYMSTDFWGSSLTVQVNQQEYSIPAEGIRGSRHLRRTASYFDSDGVIGDTNSNPLTAEGSSLIILDADRLRAIDPEEAKGKIAFIDYALLDTYINGEAVENIGSFLSLVDQGLSGAVFVTQYSNSPRMSRGTQMAEGIDFMFTVPMNHVPFLFVRIEDLAPAGIVEWNQLSKIENAYLSLDTDVLTPGRSGNMIARIPGLDPSKAVILSAHIDSANTPGAFDDASGSAVLLEIARVFNADRVKPPIDIYLVWYGSHEICTCGSAHFSSTHQDLLDRTLALINMDGLGYPLDIRASTITAAATTYQRFGETGFPLFDFLSDTADNEGINLDTWAIDGSIADNSNFDAFNVPNVNLFYLNIKEAEVMGWTYMHYGNHWHDPYETVDLMKDVSDVLVDMARLMLDTALRIGSSQISLRVPPPSANQALFVSTHTEPDNVTTSMLRELGMALSWEGYDVDLLPYQQTLQAADLENADIVVLSPTLDHPGKNNELWSDTELSLLEQYVADGGFLVVTNSSCNYAMKRCLDDSNEDARALNPLLEPMGLKFSWGLGLGGDLALASVDHPLTQDATYLKLYAGEGVPFRTNSANVLLQADYRPIAALLDYGDAGGQVLVIADLGLLQADGNIGKNHQFMKNIALYARTRSINQ